MAVTEIDPKLSRLYREASTENPPAPLDAAIPAAVWKQVSKPQRRERPWWSRWMVPASAMATLVLGVSIAFLVEREQTTGDTTIRQIAPRPASPPPVRVTESAKAKAADSAAPGVAAKKEAPVAAVPAPAPVPRPAEPAKSAVDAIPAQDRAKATEPGMVRESNVATDSAIGGLGATAPAAPPAAAAKPARMRQAAIQRSPEAWLDEIRRLKREGRETEAAEQLVEFRKAYPAHAVPETLLR